MSRVVLLSPGAVSDVRAITRFIADRVTPASAARWQASLETTIARLSTEAASCAQAHEETELAIDLRELLHGRQRHIYRILFVFDEKSVTVLRIRHASQDWLGTEDIDTLA